LRRPWGNLAECGFVAGINDLTLPLLAAIL
jgi:hypothetical protein